MNKDNLIIFGRVEHNFPIVFPYLYPSYPLIKSTYFLSKIKNEKWKWNEMKNENEKWRMKNENWEKKMENMKCELRNEKISIFIICKKGVGIQSTYEKKTV